MEEILKKIVNAQELAPDDELTKMIEKYRTEELDEECLELVSAASGQDYQVFIKMIYSRL